jgi:hypothetical protein
MRKPNLKKQQAMFTLLERWYSSGVSQDLWCKKQGISLSKFKYWYKKWKSQKSKDCSGNFIEIAHCGPASTMLEKVSVRFPNGINLDFNSNVDPHVLLTLVKQF